MNILFCGKLEELCKLASMVNKLSLPINLLCKGPLYSKLISQRENLDEKQISIILDKLFEDGLVERIEKDQLKVYIPNYIVKLEEFKEFDNLAHKIGEELSERLDSLILQNDKVIIKAFEDKRGEYSLGALVAQLTLMSLTCFLKKNRNKLKCEAEEIAEILSKNLNKNEEF